MKTIVLSSRFYKHEHFIYHLNMVTISKYYENQDFILFICFNQEEKPIPALLI